MKEPGIEGPGLVALALRPLLGSVEALRIREILMICRPY